MRRRNKWVHLGYLPYPMLHKKWQWYVLEMVRETVKTDARSIGSSDACYDDVSQRVCGQCAEGRCAVALSELGDLSGQVCGESADLAAAHRPL